MEKKTFAVSFVSFIPLLKGSSFLFQQISFLHKSKISKNIHSIEANTIYLDVYKLYMVHHSQFHMLYCMAE